MKASAKPATLSGGFVVLREDLARATPFEVGVTEFEGETWQLIVALTSEPVPDFAENQGFHVEWTGETVGAEKWLFLHVDIDGKKRSAWTFGFDCNETEVVVFIRHLLRDKRLMMAFPNGRAARVDGAADGLIERLAGKLEIYLQDWQK